MKFNKKIDAFTLSEMIVVMILTSIVVGLAFAILTIVQNHMKAIQKNLEFTTELNKLEQSLNLDFNRYSKIEFDETNQELSFSTEINKISYQFQENYIVKGADTLYIILSRKTFYFDGEQTSKGYIDAIKLETDKKTQNQHMFVFKQNDATLYMN